MTKHKLFPTVLRILCFFLVVLLFLFLVLHPWKKAVSDTAALQDGVSYLHTLDDRNVSDLNAKIADAEQAVTAEKETAASANASSDELSQTTSAEAFIAAHKEQIETANITVLSESERADYKKRLENCVVIGDSMAQAALEYGFLDDSHVFYKRGAAIGDLTDTIEQASSMLPTTVIFFTGLNDTDRYPEIADYQQAYFEKLQYAKSLMPQATIYVCSMLPPSDAFGATRPDLARAPYYDAALKDMCLSSGIGYIDTNWMVNQSLYMQDGIHFVSSFYDLWIQYICACTGL